MTIYPCGMDGLNDFLSTDHSLSEKNCKGRMEINNNKFKKQKNGESKYIKIPERYVVCLITASAAGLCYVNSLNGDFVHDDVYAIKNNGDVTGKNPLSAIFFNDFWGRPISHPSSHKSYRPLCILTFRLNYYLGHGSPYYFHVVNVLLHITMTTVFTYVCQSIILLPAACSMMSGLLFAVHPVHTEAVSGIVGRADLLASLFFMFSFISYIRSLDTSWIWYGTIPEVKHWSLFFASIVLCACSMLCKEQGITVLGLCVLYDAAVCSNLLQNSQSLHKVKPFIKRIFLIILTGVVLMAFRVWIMGGHFPKFQHQDNPASFSSSFLTRFQTFGYLWFFNVSLLLYPFTLCYDWQVGSIPLVESLTDRRNLATLSFFITILLMIWRWMKSIKNNMANHSSFILFGLALYILAFFPASNLPVTVGFVVAERILYLPSAGFCILIGYGVYLLQNYFIRHKALISSLFIFTLVAMGTKTWKQNQIWYSRESLFISGVKTLPHNAKTHYNYANYLKDIGQRESAIYHYKTAIRLYPDHGSAHNNLGTLINNVTEAEIHFQEALRVFPNHKGAHVNLGTSLYKRGEKQHGRQLVNRLLDIDSSNIEAIMVKAWMCVEDGNWTQADHYYQTALKADPGNPEIVHLYGKYLQHRGYLEEAITFYRQSYLLDSKKWTSMVSEGKILKQLGKLHEAEDVLNRALMVHRDIPTLDTLGLVYYQLGRVSESLKTYEEIIQIEPANTEYIVHYAYILGNMGDIERAENMLRSVLRRNPRAIDAMAQLANILGQQKKHNEALSFLETAVNITRWQNDLVTLESLLFQKGNHYKDLKQYMEALKCYNETVSINPRRTQAHLNLGAIYHINGDYKSAKRHYNIVLSQEPNHRLAQENLAKVRNIENGQRGT